MFENIPNVKLGLIAVSRDCFPRTLSEMRRANIAKACAGGVYECPVTVENYLRFRAENSAAPVFRKLDFPAADSELFKLANERVLIRAQIDHRAEVHIAADSRKAVVINCLHR